MTVIHRLRLWLACRLGFALIAAAWLSLNQIARAQWDNAPPTAAEREKLYKDLADESNSLQREANVLRKCVQLIKPAVVHIDSEHNSTLSRYHREVDEEAGSGTIIEAGGKFYALTNRHVVENAAADSIKIRLADGRELSPTHIWMDKPTDIAVLGIEAPNLVAARIGNAADIDIGDFVLAVGSPFGLSHSVTLGIISAKG
ncbi:MAG TPA: trypsin-like peptidase domain-containing protein, partial [Pirellulales bacterium]